MNEQSIHSLLEMKNIGPQLAHDLMSIGIYSLDDMIDLGSVEIVHKLGISDRSVCYNKLYAIEGAIQGVRWHSLSKQERIRLKSEFDTSVD